MNPESSLSALFENLQETEIRHKSINADFCVFMRRMQSLRRGIYLLQLHILEYRKKAMATEPAKSHNAAVVGSSSPSLALEIYDVTSKTEQQRATGTSQMECRISTCDPKQAEEHLNPESLKEEGSEVDVPYLNEQEPLARNNTQSYGVFSNKEKIEISEHHSLDNETIDFSNEISGLQIVQETADNCGKQDTSMSKEFLETGVTIPSTPESSSQQKNSLQIDSPIISGGFVANNDKKIRGHFPLVKANEELSAHNSSDKVFSNMSEDIDVLGKIQGKDSYNSREVEESLVPPAYSRIKYNCKKSLKNKINLLNECGDKFSVAEVTESHKLHRCSEKDSATIPYKTALPSQNMNTENCDFSSKFNSFTEECLDLEKIPLNKTIKEVPQALVLPASIRKSDENLSVNPRNTSALESFNMLDDRFREVRLRCHELRDIGEDSNDHSAKTYISVANTNISKRIPQKLISMGIQPSESREDENVNSQCFTLAGENIKKIEHIISEGAPIAKVSEQRNASVGNKTGFQNPRSVVLKCSKSDTQICLSSVTPTSDLIKWRSLECYSSTVVTDSRSIMGISTPDYYCAANDQQILLQSDNILEKKRKFFHFRWKSCRNKKRRTKSQRHNYGIFNSKSKEVVSGRDKKPRLFSRIFGTLTTCAYASTTKTCPNDLPEVLDPLEE